MAVISFIPVSAAASGIAGLAVVVAGIAAVLAALGGLKQIPGFDWLISEGTTVLGEIGYAIGDFVGSIAGGLAAGLTSGLPEMGKNLSGHGGVVMRLRVKPAMTRLRAVYAALSWPRARSPTWRTLRRP